jgi:molecular chaperone GrpE
MKKSAIKNKVESEPSDELQAKYHRALADYQNLSKQSQKDKSDAIRYANSALLNDILPVYEYLKLSLSHSDENSNVTEGLKYTLNLFQKVLEQHGISEIEVSGKEFNHHTMDAVETLATEDPNQDHRVAELRQAGYLLHDRVLRPARVVVYKLVSDTDFKPSIEHLDNK